MAASLTDTGRWFLFTTAEMIVLFLALGFLVGLLQAWLPEERVRRLFEGRKGIIGYFIGAALGAVTPFCSYSTIPVLAGLLRSGAPFGPTMAFLFASPLLDPVMLGVLVFLIGVEGTVAYAVVTFLASILVAALWSKLGLDSDVKPLGRAVATGCGMIPPAKRSVWRQAWRDTWAFFVPAVPYLMVGTAAGAVIYGFVPTGWIIALAGPGQPFAIPLAAALGIPMYVTPKPSFRSPRPFWKRVWGSARWSRSSSRVWGSAYPRRPCS